MNILFIHSLEDLQFLDKPLWSPLQMQFGISYISSFLKKHGHQTKLLVLNRALNKKNTCIVSEYLMKFKPKLICFTAVYSEYNFMASIAEYIKENHPDIYLLIGGCHVSLNPEEILLDGFDALCIGEGEEPTLELVSQLERNLQPCGIANLWIKRGPDIQKNHTRPFLQDLDSLPFPDREMWQEWICRQADARLAVLLGRGCPFDCSYCCNHALRILAPGSYARLRTPQNIIEEIRDILVKAPFTRELYLEVETLGLDKEWANDLCLLLEEFNKTLAQPLSFGANLRIAPNIEYEELFVHCARSNFRHINIGLESGSERVRLEILNRNYSNQDVVNVVKLARKYRLEVNFYNMIGIPGETLADFKKTVEMNRICLPDFLYTYIFFPYPGTRLYSFCKSKGLLKEPLDTKSERAKAIFNLPGFSRRQIQRSYLWFDYYVYKDHKPLYKRLAKILFLELSAMPYFKNIYRKLKGVYLLRYLKRKITEY